MALQSDYSEEVEFVIVDVRQSQGTQLASEFEIRFIPHTIILDSQGEVFLNEVGVKTEEYLRERLEELKEMEGN